MAPAERQPIRFFVQAAITLVILFLVTLLITPGEDLVPVLRGVQAGIAFGLVIAAGKMLMRHFNINIERPSRRRPSGTAQPDGTDRPQE
jgi:hypothetical protein